ncbi:MAG: DNA-3-methyladenine glycosylase family protein [Pikeienuella sp.]
MKIIETMDDVAEGAAWLAANDADMARAIETIDAIPLRRNPDGFAALLKVIVGQQVSTAAAAGIWARVEAAGFVTERAVLAASETDLREAGLSRAKAVYAQAIAAAALDYDALRSLPEADAMATLTAIKGVGQWTAEIYLMFAVGRADMFAPGDLALREATRVLLGRVERPTIKETAEIAKRWSPWRGVAARILFTYYRATKGREGLI